MAKRQLLQIQAGKDIHQFYEEACLPIYTNIVMESLGVCESVKTQDSQAYLFLSGLLHKRYPKPEKLHNITDLAVRIDPQNREALELLLVKQDGSQEPVTLSTCYLEEGQIEETAVPSPLKKRRPLDRVDHLLLAPKEIGGVHWHPWFDERTWKSSNRGNLTRMVGDKTITLLSRNKRWFYVCNHKLDQTDYSSLDAILKATFEIFKKDILASV